MYVPKLTPTVVLELAILMNMSCLTKEGKLPQVQVIFLRWGILYGIHG